MPTIRRPGAGYNAWQWVTIVVAGLMWILAIGLGAPLDRVLGVLASDVTLAAAGTTSLAAVILWTVRLVWCALADNQDAIVQRLDGAVPEDDLPPGAASKILKMGIRMGEKRSASEFPHLAPIYDQPRPADRG